MTSSLLHAEGRSDQAAVGSPEADVTGTGFLNLERLADASGFNRWMYDRIRPWVGLRVLEVGAGIGNISEFLVGGQRVVLSDPEPEYRERLRRRFGHLAHVSIVPLRLPDGSPEIPRASFDSVVCLNVLEHIEDDRGSLDTMCRFLAPGGRLILLVPALPMLFGTLDRALGHYRRYTPATLRALYAAAGLQMLHLEYFNLAGIPGWWFVGRVLKRAVIPAASLSLYDRLVPLFRMERLLPWRMGQSLIAIGEMRP